MFSVFRYWGFACRYVLNTYIAQSYKGYMNKQRKAQTFFTKK